MRAARDVGKTLGEQAQRVRRTQECELAHADRREIEATAFERFLLLADGVRQVQLEPAFVVEARRRLGVGEARDGGEVAAAYVEEEDEASEQQEEHEREQQETLLRVAVEQCGDGAVVVDGGGLLVDAALDEFRREVRDLLVEDAHEDGIEAVADAEAGAVREDDVVLRDEPVEEPLVEQRVSVYRLDEGEVGAPVVDGGEALGVRIEIGNLISRVRLLDELAGEITAARRSDARRPRERLSAAVDEHVVRGEVGIRDAHAVLVRPVEVEVHVDEDIRLAIIELLEEFPVRRRLAHIECDAEIAFDAGDDVVRDAAVPAAFKVGVGLLIRGGEGGEVVVLREVRLFLRRQEERRALLVPLLLE